MLTEQATTNKPRYLRYVFTKQDNRVEYRILGSDGETYYKVQLKNGRAAHCYDTHENICEARHYHPGVPCKHMEMATRLEQDRREQELADATFPEEVQEVIKVEQAKCQQVWQEKMRTPINARPQTKKWYSLERKRDREANAALNLQRAESQRVIDAAIAAAHSLAGVA